MAISYQAQLKCKKLASFFEVEKVKEESKYSSGNK